MVRATLRRAALPHAPEVLKKKFEETCLARRSLEISTKLMRWFRDIIALQLLALKKRLNGFEQFERGLLIRY